MTGKHRFQAALDLFDSKNAADPNTETWQGEEHPKELLYARRMSDTLERFAPDASEALRLAARAQHIERWTLPRGDYPEGRQGYKEWRKTLARFHAERAESLLEELDYEPETRARVGSLIRKERLKSDPEAQTLEDVICLVFLEHYFAAFAAGHRDDKVIDILRKTWRKMSPRGHAAALALELPERARELVARALDLDTK